MARHKKTSADGKSEKHCPQSIQTVSHAIVSKDDIWRGVYLDIIRPTRGNLSARHGPEMYWKALWQAWEDAWKDSCFKSTGLPNIR